MMTLAIQPLPTLVAAGVAFMLGGIWFGPLLGRTWTGVLGIDASEIGPGAYAAGVVSYVLLAGAMSQVGSWIGIDSALDGLMLGFVIWLGVAFALGWNVAAFTGRPMTAFWIEAGCQLAACLAIGAILGAWR